ncbi:unnamed protein product [Linum trigynum]|uniref:Uncharacterized protein n=1 Tax=Linum trigynum TaxID=586398 RepID=A0AAV2EFC1_9ROSI
MEIPPLQTFSSIPNPGHKNFNQIKRRKKKGLTLNLKLSLKRHKLRGYQGEGGLELWLGFELAAVSFAVVALGVFCVVMQWRAWLSSDVAVVVLVPRLEEEDVRQCKTGLEKERDLRRGVVVAEGRWLELWDGR